ncbi:DENN domain-containing protein 5B (Rab6IP1-like protein) [Durusdinium trenchii]|uniref:DENN domain-containing protein 5B (Rab6IP1-like protein) n=1 Tax=Durusdinium trenchii TaxID=1381693 RepID=A0ABP0J529_9DINO
MEPRTIQRIAESLQQLGPGGTVEREVLLETLRSIESAWTDADLTKILQAAGLPENEPISCSAFTSWLFDLTDLPGTTSAPHPAVSRKTSTERYPRLHEIPEVHRIGNEMTVEFLTDVEGNWEYFVHFVSWSQVLGWSGLDRGLWGPGELQLAEHRYLVFGGDAVDKGSGDIRVVKTLLELKRRYWDRVFIVLGNRDICKLRFYAELQPGEDGGSFERRGGAYWIPDPKPSPDYETYLQMHHLERGHVSTVRWVLDCNMGCQQTTFNTRRHELALLGLPATDEAVVDSYRDSVDPSHPDCWMLDFLRVGQLAVILGDALFIHGGLYDDCLGRVPEETASTVPWWVDRRFVGTGNPSEERRHLGTKAGVPVLVLATLPSEEALPLTDRQALQRLPEVFGPRKGFGAFGLGLRASTRTASDAAPGVAAERSTRCFCSVLEEWPRVYAAAVALELSGGLSYLCLWSDAPEILSPLDGAIGAPRFSPALGAALPGQHFLHGLAGLHAALRRGPTDEASASRLSRLSRLCGLWSWLLREVPRPPEGTALHLHVADTSARLLRPQVSSEWSQSGQHGLSAPHVPLRLLFERLSLEDVLLLCRLVLLERRILLRSSSSLILTACCEALARVLLFPLQWQHGYSPLANHQQLHDPKPWLLGMRREVELGRAALVAAPTGQPCSVFDLDAGHCTVLEPSCVERRLPELPTQLSRPLRARLSRLRAKAGDYLNDAAFDHEVQVIFLQSLAPLLELRPFIGKAEQSDCAVFDAQEYVHSQELDAQAFCRAWVETLAFRELLCEVNAQKRGRILFEEALLQLEGSIVAVTDPTPNAATDLVDENAQGSMLQVMREVLQFLSKMGPRFGESCSSELEDTETEAILELRSPSPLRLRLRLIRSCRAVPVDSIALGQDGARGPALLEGKTAGKTSSGNASDLDTLVAGMKQRSSLVQRSFRPSWLQAMASQLAAEPTRPPEEQQLLDSFAELFEAPAEHQASSSTCAHSWSGGALDMVNLKPDCFRTLGLCRMQTHSSFPSIPSSSEADAAEFLEEVAEDDASPAPPSPHSAASPRVLNLQRTCLRTPRHPTLIAAQLLRKAFLCLYLAQSIKDANKRKSSKKVRISGGTTTFDEEDFLSPTQQRRKTLRSMTTSNLSLSPSPAAARSFVAPHSPDRSPARATGDDLARRSDPTLLSSGRSPRRKFSKQALEKFETPEAVTELCLSFCELQACHPEDLDHDEREAFWLNVLNACTLAWICTTDPQKLQSNLFPMHVFLGFLQKSTVNVGGQIFSLQDLEHQVLRAHSKAPKFGWIFQGQKGFKCERAKMALESAAPEVSFGIFYPLRFGYPRLQVYYPQALPDQLLLNCAQYLFETVAVEPKKRRVTLPPLLKYYAQDFGGTSAALLHFVQLTLEAAPSLLEQLAFEGGILSDAQSLLATEAPLKSKMLEQLRTEVGFAHVNVSYAEFDWRLDLTKSAAGSWELEDMLEVAREKKMKVAPPPGRPLPGENPRQRRYVAS